MPPRLARPPAPKSRLTPKTSKDGLDTERQRFCLTAGKQEPRLQHGSHGDEANNGQGAKPSPGVEPWPYERHLEIAKPESPSLVSVRNSCKFRWMLCTACMQRNGDTTPLSLTQRVPARLVLAGTLQLGLDLPKGFSTSRIA